MHDPVLVVTGSDEDPTPYVEALKSAGLPTERIRVTVPTPETRREARHLAAGAAGMVLCGGGDLHPKHYGEEPLEGVKLELEEDRDALELELMAGARESHTPVFAVCRGFQLVNVFLGGDLWQDLPRQLPGSLLHHLSLPKDALVHTVEVVEPGNWLGEVLSRETALVNSRHHQGVRRLAPDLEAVGRAPDRLVEAVALAHSRWWLYGVQWHPENLLPMALGRALWRGFAHAVEAGEHARPDSGPGHPEGTTPVLESP